MIVDLLLFPNCEHNVNKLYVNCVIQLLSCRNLEMKEICSINELKLKRHKHLLSFVKHKLST